MVNKNLVNFNEHSFNVKVIDSFCTDNPKIIYGYLHEIDIVDDKYRNGFMLTGMRACLSANGSLDESRTSVHIYCGKLPGTFKPMVLTIGDLTLDLEFYTKDEVIDIIRDKLVL